MGLGRGEHALIKSIHHTCISVSDLELSIAFYRDMLGLELLTVEESELSGDDRSDTLGVSQAQVRLAIFRVGGTRLELIEYVTPRGRPYDRRNNDVGAMHIAFQVDDIDSAYRSLLEKDVQFTGPPATIPAGPLKGWRWTYFLDPDGVALELIQPA
jgi:catechol 2,3-dioxygenase-like lactoylglutathione lyase family enzyme